MLYIYTVGLLIQYILQKAVALENASSYIASARARVSVSCNMQPLSFYDLERSKMLHL